MLCPDCKKPVLIGLLIICAWCEYAATEPEFLARVKAAELRDCNK